MATFVAFTTTDLTSVESAIARGELTVQLADRRVTYRSMEELVTARGLIQRSLSDVAAGTTGRPRQAIGVPGKGL